MDLHSHTDLLYACDRVLVSAGIELTVFLVAGTVLCFEFSLRRMLVTLMFSVVAK